MGKKSGLGSRLNNLGHITESLDTIFGLKKIKFFNKDPGWKKFGYGIRNEKIRIRDKHPGSTTMQLIEKNLVWQPNNPALKSKDSP